VITEIECLDEISTIAVVGEGILDKHGIASKLFTAVSDEEINIKIISAGASLVAIYFIIDKKDRDLAIQKIHKTFFEN